MKKFINFFSILLSLIFVLSLSACNPVNKNYGVESDTSSVTQTAKKDENVSHPEIMSSDRIMSQFLDISLFDEENYAKIYLGKKFDFNVTYDSDEFKVPTTLSNLNKNGWKLEENKYDADSMVYACETVEAVFKKDDGAVITALFYNSSNSSQKLSKCNIVKFRIDNNFYSNPDSYFDFNVNGVNNKMAVTDVIDTLGTPSHFYALSDDNYYLDYFISEDDRRNGITVYVNPGDDMVTAIEFSYYK